MFQTRWRHVGGRVGGLDQEQRLQREPADAPESRLTGLPEPSTNSSSRQCRPIVRTTAGKIASIAAYDGHGSPGVVTDNPDRPRRSHVVVLASLTEALPTGEIPPTKPLPVPAQPPPPPEELAPAPQQPPPPPPRRVQQAPQRQQQVEPPPQEAPPQEAPPQAEQPQAPAPAPEPGGGNGGAPAPDSPSPAPPAPPGHIRLAP